MYEYVPNDGLNMTMAISVFEILYITNNFWLTFYLITSVLMMLSTMMKYLITIPNNYVSVLMLSTIFDMMKSVKGIIRWYLDNRYLLCSWKASRFFSYFEISKSESYIVLMLNFYCFRAKIWNFKVKYLYFLLWRVVE